VADDALRGEPIVGVVSMMPGLSAEEREVYFSKPIAPVIPQPEASSVRVIAGVMRKGSHHGSVACKADGDEKAGSGPEARESLGRSA